VTPAASTSNIETASLRAQIDAAASQVRMEMLVSIISAEITALLGLDAAHQPAPDQRLMELGIDSLMAIDLRNRLTRRLALTRKLTATLIFDYPTVSAIAKHLATDCLGYVPAMSERSPAPALPTAARIEDLAEDEAEALLLKKLSRL
jgi:acyl carrier protein